MKISELMAGKKPGEIKIRGSNWHTDRWFQPYYLAHDVWYGIIYNGISNCFSDDQINWIIYTEPKAKVVWVEYLMTPKPNKAVDSPLGDCRWFNIVGNLVPHKLDEYNYTKTGRTMEVEQDET